MEVVEISKVSKPIDNQLRQDRREKLKEHQEFNRLSAFDSNRLIEEVEVAYTEKDIGTICNRIKRKKHAKPEDLVKLSNAFIQSEDNIAAFLKIIGAINVVIKEFTGNDRSLNLLAAQCLCNMSLGDEVSSAKVATFAGSYLMIFILKSNELKLSNVCLWITQNIAAAGHKAISILMSQELLKNCLHILSNSVEQEHEAIKLLDIIIDQYWADLKPEEKQEVTLAAWNHLKKNFDDPIALQVFYKAAFHDGWGLDDDVTTQLLLNQLVKNLIEVQISDDEALHLSIHFLNKIILHDRKNVLKVIVQLMEHNARLSDLINNATVNPKLFNVLPDLMQLTSLIYTFDNPLVAQYFALDSMDNIRVPKMFEF